MSRYYSHIIESVQLIPYTNEEQLALSSGHQEMRQDNAYRGRFFIKNGLKWMFNIKSLNILSKKYRRL